jgi:hypothetical protein
MALDFAILSYTGEPEETVSLEPDPHYEMMMLAKELKLNKLLSFSDYYADVDLCAAKLPALAREISRLEEILPHELREFTTEFKALIGLAIAKNKPISAIPD